MASEKAAAATKAVGAPGKMYCEGRAPCRTATADAVFTPLSPASPELSQ